MGKVPDITFHVVNEVKPEPFIDNVLAFIEAFKEVNPAIHK